jgi:FkbM family methyltransferase
MKSIIDYPINWLDNFFKLKDTTWHDQFKVIFARLHLSPIPYFIDIILFKNKLRDIWEPEVSRFLLTTRGKTFIDIGACYGRFAVLLADNYERVIAIDPDATNVKTMNAIVTYGHFKNVEILKKAISDENGLFGLHTSTHSDWVHLSRSGETVDSMVETSTLNHLLEADAADLVKVDVEGWEWQVLNGSTEVLGKIKSWAIELHDPHRRNELEQWFHSHGYCTRWLDERHIFAFRT